MRFGVTTFEIKLLNIN